MSGTLTAIGSILFGQNRSIAGIIPDLTVREQHLDEAIPTGTPLVTIPVTPGRAFVEVQNQSAVNLQLVRDDGTGVNQTTIIRVPAAAGEQGGDCRMRRSRGASGCSARPVAKFVPIRDRKKYLSISSK